MVKESAPLVEIDHQQCSWPVRARDDCVVDLRHHRLACANVDKRVIVLSHGRALRLRIEVRNRWKGTRFTVGEEVVAGTNDPVVPG